MGDLSEFLGGGKKRSNGDLSAFRDELRERRLMLANLSTQPSLQQSPVSSSTSSLSSQTRSFTIQEEDGEEEEEEENESSYSLGVYEHCKISKFNYKRNRHYQLNPETAYLLQDDGDSDVREEDEDDVIPEEEELSTAAHSLSANVASDYALPTHSGPLPSCHPGHGDISAAIHVGCLRRHGHPDSPLETSSFQLR